MTPLHLACRRHHKQAISVLLANDAQCNAESQTGEFPLTSLLIGRGKDLRDWVDEYRLCVEMLLTSNADIDSCGPSGDTSLHVAARLGYREALSILMDFKANPAIENSDGHTPVAVAIAAGQSSLGCK